MVRWTCLTAAPASEAPCALFPVCCQLKPERAPDVALAQLDPVGETLWITLDLDFGMLQHLQMVG